MHRVLLFYGAGFLNFRNHISAGERDALRLIYLCPVGSNYQPRHHIYANSMSQHTKGRLVSQKNIKWNCNILSVISNTEIKNIFIEILNKIFKSQTLYLWFRNVSVSYILQKKFWFKRQTKDMKNVKLDVFQKSTLDR